MNRPQKAGEKVAPNANFRCAPDVQAIFFRRRHQPRSRLPTTYPTRGYVEVGGLMSYGPNFPASFRRAADYVHKILVGAKPGDLPVELGGRSARLWRLC